MYRPFLLLSTAFIFSTYACSSASANTSPTAPPTPTVTSLSYHTTSPDRKATQHAPQTLTAAAILTSIARVETRIALTPSRTPLPTATRDLSTPTPSNTPWPTPDWLTPVALVIDNKPSSETEMLILETLRLFVQPYFVDKSYFTVLSDNLFSIAIEKDVVNPQWASTDGIINNDRSLSVFFSYPPEPTSRPVLTPSADDFIAWLMARKMLIEDTSTGDVYWVQIQNYVPHRPIELEGWLNKDVFVFSHCGNPSLCFLTAINAQERRFLFTVQVQDFPQTRRDSCLLMKCNAKRRFGEVSEIEAGITFHQAARSWWENTPTK